MRVIMVVPVVVGVVMVMIMGVPVVVMVVGHFQTADACAECVAMVAIRHVRSGRRCALAFYVVVVGFLDCANFALEPQNLGAVFTQDAGGRRGVRKCGMRGADICGDGDRFAAFHRKNLGAIGAGAAVGGRVFARLFDDAFRKGFQHFGVVTQIACLDELGVGMLGRDLIGEAIDAVDQDAREQEIREDDDPFVAQFCRMCQARFNQRECDTGVADLVPAKADTFVQHTCDFGDVAVGVGVGCAAPDDHKAGVMQMHLAVFGIGRGDSILDAACGGGDHFGVNAQFAAIADGDAVLRGVGVQHGGNVVFGVHGCKQHTGHSENTVATSGAQVIKTVTDHGVGKFQIAVIAQPVVGQIRGELLRKGRKFIHGRLGT